MAFCKGNSYFEYRLSILNGFVGSIESPRTHLDILLFNTSRLSLFNFPEDAIRTIAGNAKTNAKTNKILSRAVKNIISTLIKEDAAQRIPSLSLRLFRVLNFCSFIFVPPSFRFVYGTSVSDINCKNSKLLVPQFTNYSIIANSITPESLKTSNQWLASRSRKVLQIFLIKKIKNLALHRMIKFRELLLRLIAYYNLPDHALAFLSFFLSSRTPNSLATDSIE